MDIEETDCENHLMIITETSFNDAQKIKTCIGDKNYYDLMRLLRFLQKAIEVGSDEEHTEWDYIKKLWTCILMRYI